MKTFYKNSDWYKFSNRGVLKGISDIKNINKVLRLIKLQRMKNSLKNISYLYKIKKDLRKNNVYFKSNKKYKDNLGYMLSCKRRING